MIDREGFEAYLLAKGQRKSTIEINLKSMKLYFEWLEREQIEATQITYNDTVDYLQYLKQKAYKQRTISIVLMAVKHYYNYLQQIKAVTQNPFALLELRSKKHQRPIECLGIEKLENLYLLCPNGSLVQKRDKIMLGLVIFQALTSEEIIQMETKDIDLQRGVIYVSAKTRKNERKVALSAMQTADLIYFINTIRPLQEALLGRKSRYLFVEAETLSSLVANSMTRLLKKLRKIEPTLKDIQQIRSSVLVHWLKNESLRKVQYKSGMKYVSSLEKYRSDKLEGLQQMIAILHPLK